MFELHGYGSYTVQTNHLQRLSTAVLLVVGTPDYLHLDASIRNTDSVCLISKFSQSVNQSVCLWASVACTKLSAHPGQCRRALQHHSSQSRTRNCTHTDCLALASLSHSHCREHSSTKVPHPRHHPPPTTPPSITLRLETTC